ncbi:SHOCT domain-containing protein [Desulfitobacterium sp. THU1]|uniref:SHOCT domain-containing protein n=1 Tax=Desulfitobacterium sp. THU1 TaxID=3138072 RepID=UPI00311F940A
MMMWGYGPWSGGGNWFSGLAMMAVQVLFWVLIIWFGVSLFKRGNERTDTLKTRSDAMDILRERYAGGEIDSEEFHRRKEDLTK